MQRESQALRRRLFPLGDDRASAPGNRDAAHFLVTSWGHSGSIWLAGSLNLHDAVCATVGIDNPIESFQYYKLNKDAAFIADTAGAALSRHGFTNWNSPGLAPLRPLAGLYNIEGTARNPGRLPWYVFDELDLIPAKEPYVVLGNVHGITLSQMHTVCVEAPDIFKGRRVLVIDLIRHPVGRTESAINATINYHLPALEPRMAAFLHDHVDECVGLERRYHVDFSEPRARAALHVYRQGLQNDVWAYELRRFADVHRILLERLQTDREYFAQAFYTLGHGRVAADSAYLDRVFDVANLGSGRQNIGKTGRPPGPRDQYDRWSAFERDEFARVSQRLDAPALYFPFGYDFSFVTRSPLGGASWFSEMVDPGSNAN